MMRTMRNVQAQLAVAAALAVAGGAGLCPSAQGASYVETPSGQNLVMGFTEFNHVQIRLDLPGAEFNWIWHPGSLMIHRDASGSDIGTGIPWIRSESRDLQDRLYVIEDYRPDGAPHANDYSWGDEIAWGIIHETVDLASTQFTINFNLYATDGDTSTGGEGTQSLRKSFDVIHYANNTWNFGTAGNWYYDPLNPPSSILPSGMYVALGPTGEDVRWYRSDTPATVGGGTWNPGYLTTAPVPEPTMLSLLGIAALGLARRRH